MRKVSFDFDSTLKEPNVQEYAKELIKRGFEVWIVTSRFDDDPSKFTEYHPSWMKSLKYPGINDDLRKVAKDLNIPNERIIYTNMALKVDFVGDMDFEFHLDDDVVEVLAFNEKGNILGILQDWTTEWKKTCEDVINNRI